MASKVLIYISQLFYSSALIILIKIQSVKYNLTFTACRFYVLKVRHSLEFPFFLFINSLCLSILYNFFLCYNCVFHLKTFKLSLILSHSNILYTYCEFSYNTEHLKCTSYCKYLFLETLFTKNCIFCFTFHMVVYLLICIILLVDSVSNDHG